MYQQLIDQFIQSERLPTTYGSDARQFFVPLFEDIKEAIRASERRPFMLGINGAQGTGKSTLAKLLCTLLEEDGFRVANLSIDDFYYSKARRLKLASNVHPLLSSRGVPGTHDVELALKIMQQLAGAGAEERITLPGFDKAVDDCLPREACTQVQGPIDLIILEGWFVGVRPQSTSELAEAANDLEKIEDKDARWRNYVNDALSADYQPLFSELNMLVMLAAPGFEQILEWRSLQEEKLRRRAAAGASGLMDRQSIERFIAHFERLTRHCLSTLPKSADRVYRLDAQHRIHLP